MKTDTIETQKGKLLEHLYGTFNKIDALDALRIAGTMKLSTRLGEIAKEQNLIIRKEKQPGSKFLKYWIEAPTNQLSL